MTKMSQCSTCIGDGVHCEHYRPTDDSPCPNYIFDTSSTEQGTIKYEVKNSFGKVSELKRMTYDYLFIQNTRSSYM